MADVNSIVTAAAQALGDNTMIIAVTDRVGNVLAVYRNPGAPATTSLGANFAGDVNKAGVNANDLAISLARTASFFSNDQAPLSSRTVRYISGIHFPPGVMNQPNADLYGIENTNRGCQLVPPANFLTNQALPPSTSLANPLMPGLGITTGKADLMDSNPIAVSPGGVPIFKNNPAGQSNAVGGVGVVASNLDAAEFAAFSGAFSPGFGITSLPPPGVVIVGGIALPFVTNTTRPAGFSAGTFTAANFVMGPIGSPLVQHAAGNYVPEGDLIAPAAGPVGGLTAAQVTEILNAGEAVANATRGVIRLPLGSRARMVFAVADLNGTLIGLRRMRDATIFSVDVAASKARNMTYFNASTVVAADLPGVAPGTAVTNRTISFSAMPLFPPGIDGTPPGPIFAVFRRDVMNPCTQGAQPPPIMGPLGQQNQSGIVFFPGSVGIYDSTGKLMGGFGVSGDGVDQDDFVTTGGASGGINATPTCTGTNCYLPPSSVMRADQFCVLASGAMASCGGPGVRLPFSKFPRDPTN